MENQDKIYSQFKNAAEKSEVKDFPNMDKVWNRVEEKLDKKVLKKQNTLWKKVAVAASILLVASVGYQFLKSDNEISLPNNSVVEQDSISVKSKIQSPSENAVVINESDTSLILKKDAAKILKEQISKKAAVVTYSPALPAQSSPINAEISVENDKSDDAKSGSVQFNGRKFDAIGVVHDEVKKESAAAEQTAKKAIQIKAKSEPLLVIDNKAITSKEGSNYSKISKKELENIKSEDLETVVYLKEPLYIIDGKQYSEEELFGEKPTSPYAPLSEQEIKTTKVLQGEEAIAAYGEKGAKGVLIITTKNGRPVNKTPKKN